MEANFKNLKPSLSKPTEMGKNFDTNFKKTITKHGMKLKEVTILEEKKESLKKKIFKLDKMETLVHSDEFLSKVFSELEQDADQLYGYHWNETLMNIIFNEYVLNSPKYLQKYKNTRAKKKKRRGEEGIKELQKDLEKEKEATIGAEKRKQDLLSKNDNSSKEELDEIWGFSKKNIDSKIPFENRSIYDTFFVNVKNNKLIEPVPAKLSNDEKMKIVQKYVGNKDIKQIAWFDAVTRGVEGVEKEVPDGSYDEIKKEMDKKYPKDDDKNLSENIKIGDKYKISDGSGLDSNKIVTVVKPEMVKVNGNGIPTNVSGAYKPVDWKKEVAVEYDDGSIGTIFKSRLRPIMSETTGAASGGAYTMGLDAQNGFDDEIADKTYQNETTTSSSSGQYSGKAIWAKNPAKSRFANKPAWHGGKVIQESVINGDMNYLSDSTPFKKYIIESEINEYFNETFNIEEGETFKETAKKLYNKLIAYSQEMPNLKNDDEFNHLLYIFKYEAETGKAHPSRFDNETNQEKNLLPMEEHHLFNRKDIIDFMMKNGNYDMYVLNKMSDDELNNEYMSLENELGINEQSNFHNWMKKDLEYTGHKLNGDESTEELEKMDGLFKDKWVENESVEEGKGLWHNIHAKRERGEKPLKKGEEGYPDKKQWDKLTKESTDLSEKASSKSQQRIMGMALAYKRGELDNASPEVVKLADSMSEKDLEDFAGTKHKGLPKKVSENVDNIDRENLEVFLSFNDEDIYWKWINNEISSSDAINLMRELNNIDYNPNINYRKIYIGESMKEGIFDFKNELKDDEIVSAIENFKLSQESPKARNRFVKVKDYIKSKVGNVERMPQLKLWLDKNMPKISRYVDTLWGNWDLMSDRKLAENMKNENYKKIVKELLESTGKSFKMLNEDEKRMLFEDADLAYMSLLSEKWDETDVVNPAEKGKHSGKTLEELRSELKNAKERGDTDTVRELNFAIRAKTGWGKVNESMIDDQPDSMINNQSTSMVKSMESPELNVAASSIGGVKESEEVEPQFDDTKTSEDAKKFREMLKTKYGVESVSDLSNKERQELMKSMNLDKDDNALDFSQFKATDAERDEFIKRDMEKLEYLSNHNDEINSLSDYKKLSRDYKMATGENMHHPMAILASIQRLPSDSILRNKLKNIENVLQSAMSGNINEERKTSALLNVEKLGKENAKNFERDKELKDGLKQDQTYPKQDAIHKAPVYPNPQEFYIEQDLEKVQKEAKSMEEIEKEALKKAKGAFNNIGNSTNEKGNEIPKRNLTKEEGYQLAMNRGDGMQDIVYDNKPSDRFEKRMERDMGEDIYKLRKEKMAYKAKAPMYNKDGQPIAHEVEKNNKFAKGYNSESVTGKYKDEFNKYKIVEFKLSDVEIVNSIDKNFTNIILDGIGNKYEIKDGTLNEDVVKENIINNYDFYLSENSVFAIKKTNSEKLKNVNESFNKMKHLMKYNPNDYVDTKKSVKY